MIAAHGAETSRPMTGNPADINDDDESNRTMKLTDAEYCARARKAQSDSLAKAIKRNENISTSYVPEIPGPNDPAGQRNYRESDEQTGRLMGTLIGSAVVSAIFLPLGPAALLFGAAGGTIVHAFVKNKQDY